MKLSIMTLAMTLAFSSLAQAEVKAPGTFVPTLCSTRLTDGASTQTGGVASVCVGQLAQMDQSAIRIRLESGEERTYSMNMEKKAGRMGVTNKRFSGDLMTLRMIDRISGVLTTTSGITTSFNISLKTSTTGLEFSGPLHMVFVTQ